MTRKQMISTLRGMDFGSTIGSKGDEALRMAIAELEQQPCDTISREAVVYYIKSHIQEIISESGIDKNEHTNRVLRAIVNGVETMPSVTQKSGKWITVDYLRRIYKCSECQISQNPKMLNYRPNYNYCPYCGAKMVEPQESEE